MEQKKRERLIKHYKTHKEREIQIEKLIDSECVCEKERERETERERQRERDRETERQRDRVKKRKNTFL
jgi:hypothetical protein